MSNILLKNLVDGPITPQMIVYVTQKATSVIPCDSMLSSLSSSSSSTLSNSNSNHTNNKSNNKNNNNKNNNNKNLNQSSSASSLSINTDNNHVHHIHHDEDLQLLPPLQNFIQRLVTRSSVSTATFLTTIIYLDRLKKKLPKLARGMHCTRHRVFLAILIVASKYLNDSSPRNKYWARFSSVYSVNKVNLMERQLLTLLDYDLRVTEAELLLHLSPFLKSPSLSTSYNNNSTGNALIDTLKLPYPINSNLNNNNNGNLDNLDNHTINNSNEYIQRTCSYPQISVPKSLPLSMYDNDNNMNTINNNNNNVFSSPSSFQSLIIDNNNNHNYNDDNDDAMNTDEDDEFSSNNNNVNTVINDNSFSNFSQNIDQHQTKDQFGRRLSSTSTCSSSSTSSSITTPTSVPTAFQNNSSNLLLQQQLNHLQLLQIQLNLFNKQSDIPSIPSIITPTSTTNYLQSQHQLNQNSHSHHHHHYQQQSSFQPPPLKSLLSDAGADNYFGSSDFNNNNHNQIHHSHYNNYNLLNVNNNNNFHQHYNHIILPNPVNTTTTSSNVSYME